MFFEYEGVEYQFDARKAYDLSSVVVLPCGQHLGIVWSGLESYPPPVANYVPLRDAWVKGVPAVPAQRVSP